MTQNAATIYALATAHGKGGVAILRISGPQAFAALAHLGVTATPAPRYATRVRLSQSGQLLDDALALIFPGPHSFTGEDVLELHTHGGKAVTQAVLAALATCPDLRLAEPGEFTRRAFLNNKMDLAQAEGLADLIDAETQAQRTQALRQLGGEASARVAALRERILTPLALLEAYIDFPEEEIPEAVLAETTANVAALTAELRALLNDGGVGQMIRDGVEIVILGPPNAGKSSLLNALARRDVAIVSDEAGTTRDMLEVHLELAGYEATLVDTAGLREAEGRIEAEGIRRARARGDQADFKLLLLDAGNAAEEFAALAPLIDESTILITTKSDISAPPVLPVTALHLSTVTGEGVAALIDRLRGMVVERMESHPSPLITRARHREALTRAELILGRWSIDLPLELACEELRAAAEALGKITGKIWVDDLLDLIFSRFCIGK